MEELFWTLAPACSGDYASPVHDTDCVLNFEHGGGTAAVSNGADVLREEIANTEDQAGLEGDATLPAFTASAAAEQAAVHMRDLLKTLVL
mmetsp:Transcript_17330/g.26823  ORF Transcript_17330/g.26823 Transcript_17330/m.26823 type:complete len:90 (-) Transcript_17330:3-272(-)